MFEYFEAEKAKKKAMTSAEKKEAKAAKDALEAPYTHCVLDGRKEKVGNFRIEPPGLFRGRGDHPKKGCLKVRDCVCMILFACAENYRSCVLNPKMSRSISVRVPRYPSLTSPASGRRSYTIRQSPGWRTGSRT